MNYSLEKFFGEIASYLTLLLFAFAPLQSEAQDQNGKYETVQSKPRELGSLLPAERQELEVGKKFWIEGTHVIGNDAWAIEFCPEEGFLSKRYCERWKRFTVAETEQLEVLELIKQRKYDPEGYYRIRFASGKIAFIEAKDFVRKIFTGPSKSAWVNRMELKSTAQRIFLSDPAEVRIQMQESIAIEDRETEAQRLTLEKAERARVLRGGVRIGMIKTQVMKSSWGKPQSINRTIVAGQIHEQWVYGEGSYLYFDNERLVAIQTDQ